VFRVQSAQEVGLVESHALGTVVDIELYHTYTDEVASLALPAVIDERLV
jgi:hypothetical protein